MPLRNFSKMVLLDRSMLKLNSIVLPLMRMVSAIVVEPMELFTVGIKRVILVWFLRHTQVIVQQLFVMKVCLFHLVKITRLQFILLSKVNSNTLDRFNFQFFIKHLLSTT